MDQEITQTCVTFVGNNWWTRKGLFAVGGGLEDGYMFLDNRWYIGKSRPG